MNRKIKFRAIDALTGKMVYGDFTNGQKITQTGLTPRLMVGGYEVVPETVGQFVELLDINKKEIYEGDIVKWIDSDGNERQDVVTWMNGGLCLCNSSYTVGHYGNIEVIGNIHENPELLKGGNQ